MTRKEKLRYFNDALADKRLECFHCGATFRIRRELPKSWNVGTLYVDKKPRQRCFIMTCPSCRYIAAVYPIQKLLKAKVKEVAQ